MTALLPEINLFLIRAASELRSMGYGPKDTLWTLFCMPFRAYLHLQLMYEETVHAERLLYYCRYLLYGLEVYVRYNSEL